MMGCHIAYTFFRFMEMAFGLLPTGADRSLAPFAILMSFPGMEIRFGPTGEPLRAPPGTVARRLRASALAFAGSSLCSSLLAALPPADPHAAWAILLRPTLGRLAAEYCRCALFAGCLAFFGNLCAAHVALWHGYDVVDPMGCPVVLSQVRGGEERGGGVAQVV